MAVTVKVAALGHSTLDEYGRVRIQASLDGLDEQQYPAAHYFAGLGVAAMPYGPSEDGHCEGILLDHFGGYTGVIVGARDGRTTGVYGKLGPGDTVMHSTGPKQAAQVQCKEEGQIVAAITKDSKGKTCGIIIQGEDDTISVVAFGHLVQITRDGGIQLSSRNGQNGISVTDDVVHIRGNVVLGGMAPVPGMAVMLGPLAGQAGSPVPLVPAVGVSVGP